MDIGPGLNRSDRTGGASNNGKSPPGDRLRRYSRPTMLILIAAVLGGSLWAGVARVRKEALLRSSAFIQNSTDSVSPPSSAFTPAHASFSDALREYLGLQSTPVQPIAFNHKIHIQKQHMECTGCHSGAPLGPDAGIPSVTFCMACHQVIAAQNPEIKKLAAYAAKGQDVPWQRVYWFYPDKHVRFWHSPHIRAGVACSECHGDVSQQTVAVRSKDLTMNFCLNCHWAKGVSVDCTTCHY